MENYQLLYGSVLEIPKIVLRGKTVMIVPTVNFHDTSSTYSKFRISSIDGRTVWFVFKKSDLLLNTVAFYSTLITNKTVQVFKLEGNQVFI